MKIIFLLLPVLMVSQNFFSTPSVVNPFAAEPQCICNSSTVWVDVMLVFDSSVNAAANKSQFLEKVSAVTSDMARLNIQQTTDVPLTKYHTRIGVISYGNEAHMDSYLGRYNKAEFINQDVTYTQDQKTNISDALRLAMDQFDTNYHRIGARRVIVLVANTLTNYEVSPLAQATEFKRTGGIIVVYYFDPIVNQYNTDIVYQLASPGYFILRDGEPDFGEPQLVKAMCDANCFCPDGFITPMADPVRGYPIAGCHTTIASTANMPVAQNTCDRLYNGTIALAKYREKSLYLESLLGNYAQFWLGLTSDQFFGTYYWADGTALNTTATAWHPFASNLTSTTQSCVFEENMTWKPVDCKNSQFYLCEAAPCSSQKYCHDY